MDNLEAEASSVEVELLAVEVGRSVGEAGPFRAGTGILIPMQPLRLELRLDSKDLAAEQAVSSWSR